MPGLNFQDNFIPHPEARGAYSGGDVLSVVRNSRSGGLDSRNFANLRRPFFDAYDRPVVRVFTGRFTINKGQRVAVQETRYIHDLERRGWRIPITANATTLRKEEWLELDRVVLRAARLRLRAWADIAAANSYGGFNGMAKTTLEHETMSDPGEAIVDMDALTEGRTDAPLFQLEGLPLPITHSDFWYSSRFLAESRNTGTPLDVVSGEAAGRRVGEMIEKTTIGMTTGITGTTNTLTGGYGRTPKVYGMINFPARLTMTTLTAPTGSNPQQTLADVLTMRQQLYNGRFYGPFMLYHTNDWDTYMDNDYLRAVVGSTSSIGTTQTLRDRLREIDDIQDVRRLDFFFGTVPGATTGNPYSTAYDATLKTTQLVLLQMTPDVVQAVNGLDITTVQWETVGGMKINFKVLAIQVPRYRADYYGNCGIAHGTTS